MVYASGRLDAASAAEFDAQVCAVLEEGPAGLILDFHELTYISSIGLRAILTCAKRAKQREIKLALSGLSGSVLQVIQLSGFDTFLPLFDTAEIAASSL